MLARYVRPGGARVLQLGGSTRDLFYYPQGTVQVRQAGGWVGGCVRAWAGRWVQVRQAVCG